MTEDEGAPSSSAYFRNPVLRHELDPSERGIAALRHSVAFISSLGDAEILRRMPVQTPRIHNACPGCRRGATSRDPSWDLEQPHSFGTTMARLHRGAAPVYDPAHPERYSCPGCGEVFPGDNPRFAQDRTATMLTQLGGKVTAGRGRCCCITAPHPRSASQGRTRMLDSRAG
jgi:hypothetical protein